MKTDYGKKGYKLAVFALVLALLAFSVGGNTTTSSTNTTNQTLGLQIIINNTNLAPSVIGETPGTNERVSGATYFNNNSDIELFAFSHGNSTGQNSEIHLFINGTKVLDTSGKPLGVAEQNNRSITAIVPRSSYYMLEFNNYHHYEWREYLILSGNITSNFTSSVDQTALNLKVNKSGDTMTGDLIVQNITHSDYITITALNEIYLQGGNSSLYMNTDFYYAYDNLTKFFYQPKTPFLTEYIQFDTPMRYSNDSNYYDNNITGVYNLNMTGSLSVPEIHYGNEIINLSNSGFLYTSNGSIIIEHAEGDPLGIATNLDLEGNNILNCGNCSEFSKLIKTTSISNGSLKTGSNTISHGVVRPNIGEGNLFENLTITPTSANSKIKACAQVVMSTSATSPNLLQVMMFINNNSAVAISGAYSPAQYYEVNTGVCYTMQVPSTTPFNVSVRYGSNAVGQVTVNGAAGSQSYGGAYNSYIIVDEYKD